MNGKTNGHTYCPSCRALTHHIVISCDVADRPKTVMCPKCGHRWEWPSVAEFERREKEYRREKSRSYYKAHGEHVREMQRLRRRVRAECSHDDTRGDYGYGRAVCPTCKTQFDRRGPNHIFCCAKCKRADPEHKRKKNANQQSRRMTLRAEIAALTDEVAKLRAENAALKGVA